MRQGYCPACGNEIGPDDRFCTSCGAVVEADGVGPGAARAPGLDPGPAPGADELAAGAPRTGGVPRWVLLVGGLGVIALLAALLLQSTRPDGAPRATALTPTDGPSGTDCPIGVNPQAGMREGPDLPPAPTGIQWVQTKYSENQMFFRTCGTSDAFAKAVLEASLDSGSGSLEEASPAGMMFAEGYGVVDPTTGISHLITCRVDDDYEGWVACTDESPGGGSGLKTVGIAAIVDWYEF